MPIQTSSKDFLSNLTLDQESIPKASQSIEHDRKVAIHDLLELNYFKPKSAPEGPYHLYLGVHNSKSLVFKICTIDQQEIITHLLSLAPFKRLIHDYQEICNSYFDAIKQLTPLQIETIDMARRAIHDEGAQLLHSKLEDKVKTDIPTTRRLFTLIFVLHANQ